MRIIYAKVFDYKVKVKGKDVQMVSLVKHVTHSDAYSKRQAELLFIKQHTTHGGDIC